MPEPIADKYPAVPWLRFRPAWGPNSLRPVTGLIKLNLWLRDHLPPGDKFMVELGTYGGESATIFSSFDHWTQISCVDRWLAAPPLEAAKERLVEGLHTGRVSLHQKLTVEAAQDPHYAEVCPHGDPHFIYIDADHSYKGISADLQAWYPHLAPGGIIGGHDYNPRWEGVVRAANEFAVTHQLDILRFEDTSFLLVPRDCGIAFQ